MFQGVEVVDNPGGGGALPKPITISKVCVNIGSDIETKFRI